jgi:hypothetical protein
MPAIAEQVATIEHDLQEALAKVESLAAEKEALTNALTVMTSEKSDLEAKHNDMQALVDETREMVDRLANMSLTMLRSSRRKVAAPELNDGDMNGDGASSELTGRADAATRPAQEFTGQNVGLKCISPSGGMTAAERLRAGLLFDTAAAGALMRSPPARLPEGTPIFLQPPKNERLRDRAAR